MEDDDEANRSYSTQHIDDLLRCPICLDRYRTPRLLPCQHTFCQSPCLEQLVDRFYHIKCPECRVEHRVPYAGVSAFAINRTLQNFLDLPVQARQLQQATSQPATNAAEGRVSERPPANNTANENQPQQNEQSQRRPQNVPPVNETPRTGCSACGRQLTLSRCAHCDNVLCDTCKRSHIEQLRLDINRLVSQLRRGIPLFSDAVSVIENKSEQLHQRAEAGKAEITEMIERYISELRNRQRLLHSEVQMWLLGEIRSLRMLQENVEVELASTASFCDSTDSVLSRPNTTIPDEDLVDLRRQCVEHMEIIRTYEDGNGIRLPRERRVEVSFEGNRFSQAISNFGELSVTERDEASSSDNSNVASDPPSITSRSSSSRESSPAVVAMGGIRTTDASPQLVSMGGMRTRDLSPAAPARATGAQPSLDTALMAIGSSSRVAARREERSAGIMGGGGASEAPETSGTAPRATPRERLAGLMGGGGGGVNVNPSPRAQRRERTAGLFGGESSSNDSGPGSADSTPLQRRRNLSWELPLDFSYPPRSDIRVGNGNQSNTNTRRSLQERRRHNLSDSRLLNNIGANARQEAANQSRRRRNRSGNQTSQNSSQQEAVASTSAENSDRPPPVVRSRTFTREEFQAIREEDNASRASSADSINRSREAVTFSINIGQNGDASENEETTYRVTAVDGGESVRVNVPRNNYQDKGRAIIRFGTRGSNESEFVWPRGLTVSRSDQVYVADSSNHRVQVFDNIGNYIKSFGSYGQGDGEFDCLAGITMNTMGDFLITDRYNHRVQVFDSNGNFTFTFGEEGNGDGQMCYPWGIACDSMGFIYVCDKENHRIQVFQSNGVFARKFGRLGSQNGQFENPHYLAISLDNKIYVSDSSNHRIQVFSMYGDYIFQFGSVGTMQGQMKYPKGISIDEQGFVVVADSGNNRIQVFRGDGRFYCMFGSYGSDNGQFKGLEGLAILGNGNVAVSDRENHRIQIF
ncbi:RING finger protein nhl-1-like [Mercenaria mercenaria]|uniref:RING finger protein nhl-1-like n=1 Tax=Mercenaria mercenaria TaxID=6596 RepID=UPI00234EB325|nr:RING finger protein nhl-1-like [Mercenaria mercenaria]